MPKDELFLNVTNLTQEKGPGSAEQSKHMIALRHLDIHENTLSRAQTSPDEGWSENFMTYHIELLSVSGWQNEWGRH